MLYAAAKSADGGKNFGKTGRRDEKSELLSLTPIDTAIAEIEGTQAELVYAHEPDAVGKPSYQLGPHIFKDMDPKSALAREEIFAPVVSLKVVKDFNEALKFANDSDMGLTAALISRDPEEIRQFFEQIECGTVYVNRAPVGALVGYHWFGGIKNSGTGPMAGGNDDVVCFTLPEGGWHGRVVTGDLPPAEASKENLSGLVQFQQAWAGRRSKPAPDSSVGTFGRLWASFKESWREGIEDPQVRRLRQTRLELLRQTVDHWAETHRQEAISIFDHAETLLSPRPTFDHEQQERRGELSRVVYDRPHGVGLVWTEGENPNYVRRAVLSALVMGNAVVLPVEAKNRVWIEKFRKELVLGGVPEDLIHLSHEDGRSFLSNEMITFAVSHGPQAAEVSRRFLSNKALPVGFRHFVGITSLPTDEHYLTQFAASRTLVFSALRHGVLINLPEVFPS